MKNEIDITVEWGDTDPAAKGTDGQIQAVTPPDRLVQALPVHDTTE